MSKFCDNLNELMIYQNKSKYFINQNYGINRSSLAKYCRGDILPEINNLIKLADCFNCSIDFLLGLREDDNFSNFNKNIEFDSAQFLNRFYVVAEFPKFSLYNIARKININEKVLYTLKKVKKPRIETVINIAKAYDVSVDYLLGRKNTN